MSAVNTCDVPPDVPVAPITRITLYASIQTCEYWRFICDQETFTREPIPEIDSEWTAYMARRPEDIRMLPRAKFERVTDEYMESLRLLIERSIEAPKDVWRLMQVVAFYYDLLAELDGTEKFTKVAAGRLRAGG